MKGRPRKYPKIFKCLNCGIDIPNIWGQQRKYCNSTCQLNYEYKTGQRDKYKITIKAQEARRKGDTHQNFRKRVFNFYPNQCAICGSKEKLEAHHIIPQEYEGRIAKGKGDQRVRNGIILCHKCHMYKFSDKDIKKAFELYSKNNNLRLTSRISKIPKSTLVKRFKIFK
jgi:5-methylcytosine-specific restriction endonuclease McrA